MKALGNFIAGCIFVYGASANADTVSPQPNLQDLFNRASQALVDLKPLEAVTGFEEVEARLGRAKGSENIRAIVAVRKGRALAMLGRERAAKAQLEAGLAKLAAMPGTQPDRLDGLGTMGQIDEQMLDYPGARQAYTQLFDAAVDDQDRLTGLLGIARTAMFDDPSAALQAIDQSARLVSRMAGSLPKDRIHDLEGQLYTLRGRIELNRGNLAAGRDSLEKALDRLGGLTAHSLSLSDVAVRSDLAVVAMLEKKPEVAKKYLAYTGAGIVGQFYGLSDGDITLPDCNSDEGIRPDDFAVVEFSVREDGSIGYARPVYGSRPGGDVLAFARAVRSWSWDAEQVKALNPFFRQMIRLKLQCSSPVHRIDPSSLMRETAAQWFAAKGVRPIAPSLSAPELGAELTALRNSGATPIDLLPVLMNLGRSRTDFTMATQANAEARRIAMSVGAPGSLVALIEIEDIDLAREFKQKCDTYDACVQQAIDAMNGLLGRPAIQADPAARSFVNLLVADKQLWLKRDQEALGSLKKVAQDKALAVEDPFRRSAFTRISSIEARADRLEQARAAYLESGQVEGQCALMDAQQRVTEGATPAFPYTAFRWGFEGFAMVETDIKADGSTDHVRALVSYPPFIFEDSALMAVRNSRYTQSYRPHGETGCAKKLQLVRFAIGS